MAYNPNKQHQRGTKAFKDLNYKQQALSINGSIADLKKAIRFHARFGAKNTPRTERQILDKCVSQVEGLANQLR